MPLTSIGNADLYYEIHGEGEPLLLVAGLGGVCDYWFPNVGPLAAAYQVVLHDHRGTGQSSRSDINYSVSQMAADLVRLMDRLKIERAHLVGHSTGGAIGQEIAIQHPDRLKSLVLYGSWARADAWMARTHLARKEMALSAGMEAYQRATPVFLYPDWWINANDSVLRERENRGTSHLPSPTIAASRIDAVLAFDRSTDLHRVRVPTLVLCALDDFLTPLYCSEQLAELIPGAQLRLLERGGHACSESVAPEFNAVLMQFLASCKK